MLEKIKEIVGTVLELDEVQIEKINIDSDLLELGLDSLNAIEVIVNLESEFDMEVEDEDLMIDNLSTIDLLCNLIKKYKG
ncbi:MAG: acyl carrier protein [Eubacterium sp.]|nr:acyl carrier protein [Eubacterium sp.]